MELENLLQQVIEVVKEASKFIADQRKTFSENEIHFKGRNDLVSYVDQETEKLLIEKLRKLVPEAGFIAEESSPDKNTSELNWIIDPLDGTTNFIHNMPAYAVSVALASKKEILLGVVHNIPLNELFYAHKDGGSFMNGKEISVSKHNKLSDCLVATGFPVKDFTRLQGFLDTSSYFMQNTRGIRRLGAAAVDMCYVACGRFDGFFEYNLSAWDVAAGVLIVKQAGGKVSDFTGGDNYLFGKEMVAASESVYIDFQRVVSDNFTPKKS